MRDLKLLPDGAAYLSVVIPFEGAGEVLLKLREAWTIELKFSVERFG